ncbi:MAG: IniB N-terminal domain-containing protein [Pseudonocardiaceae bacterium]
MSDVLSVSSLIEFLMNLLRDEEAQAEFERDPQGMLARHGLDGLCGQDVRDARPLLADHEAVRVKGGDDDDRASGSYYHGGDDDPVREIHYVREHYEADKNVVVNNEYDYTYVDDRDTIINVDDRDTTTIVADGDVTIEDSFNEDNDVTVIEDSFNEDNDGVDNKGGTIDESVVAGDGIESSLNSDDDTTVGDSFDEDHSETDVDASDSGATEEEDDDAADPAEHAVA